MKRLILSLIAVLSLTTALSAQNNAIGVRIGAIKGLGGEISYQGWLDDINRIQADLGFRVYNHWSIGTFNASYQLHWFLTEGLGVYAGPDIQMAIDNGGYFNLGFGAIAGFDYHFDAPFMVSLDFRPTYNLFAGYLRGFDPCVALGLRYTF